MSQEQPFATRGTSWNPPFVVTFNGSVASVRDKDGQPVPWLVVEKLMNQCAASEIAPTIQTGVYETVVESPASPVSAIRESEDAELGRKVREMVSAGRIDVRNIMALFPNLRSEPQHVCGLSGYNPVIDPPCPGCEARRSR